MSTTHRKLLAQCKNGAMALRHTIANTSISQEDLAAAVGKTKRVLSRALGGGCGLPIDSLLNLMRESNSVYLLEYMCHQMGGQFRFYTPQEREMMQLEDRMEEIKGERIFEPQKLLAHEQAA
jgi:hypothetical protein